MNKGISVLEIIMKKCTFFILILFISGSLWAKERESLIPEGSKVYITPMDQDFNTFLAGEISKQHVPIKLVLDEKQAEYIIMGTLTKNDHKWSDTVEKIFLHHDKDQNQGSIMLVNPQDTSVIWAGNAGDKKNWFIAFSKKGPRKVALRLVKEMNKVVFD